MRTKVIPFPTLGEAIDGFKRITQKSPALLARYFSAFAVTPSLSRPQIKDGHHDAFPAREFFPARTAQILGSASGNESSVVTVLVNQLLCDLALAAVAAHGRKGNPGATRSFPLRSFFRTF